MTIEKFCNQDAFFKAVNNAYEIAIHIRQSNENKKRELPGRIF